MDYGNRIKELRILASITAKKLSEELGISNIHLSYIENNSRKPSLDLLERVCSYFNISVTDFFNDTSPTPIISNELQELVTSSKGLTPKQLELITQLMEEFK